MRPLRCLVPFQNARQLSLPCVPPAPYRITLKVIGIFEISSSVFMETFYSSWMMYLSVFHTQEREHKQTASVIPIEVTELVFAHYWDNSDPASWRGKQAVPLYNITFPTSVGKDDTQIRHKLETKEVKFRKVLSCFKKSMNQLTLTIF